MVRMGRREEWRVVPSEAAETQERLVAFANLAGEVWGKNEWGGWENVTLSSDASILCEHFCNFWSPMFVDRLYLGELQHQKNGRKRRNVRKKGEKVGGGG